MIKILTAVAAVLSLAACSPGELASADGFQTAITGKKTLDPVAMNNAPLMVAPAPEPVVIAAAAPVAAPAPPIVEPAPVCVPHFRMPCPGDE